MIEKREVVIEPLGLKRRIHLYLPDNYYDSDEHYPVMYMFDGHNLFNDYEATYGKSWGLNDFLCHYDKPFIVVGIECNHEGKERLHEYCPYVVDHSYLGALDGRGASLMAWVVNTLKPIIDRTYRTYPFRECTGIGGSSMGGLMALYGILKYNQYFSKAACLSPSLAVCCHQLEQEMFRNDFSRDTRVYFSFGSDEVDSVDKALERILIFNNYMLRHDIKTHVNIVVGGKHNEASWEKENLVYFDFLWRS